MRRNQVLAVLRAHREELRAMGAKSLALFGSVARDEAHPDSDVDILIEPERPMGFFKFLEIKQHLEALLGCSVDLVTREAVLDELRDEIAKDEVHVP